MFLGTWRSYLSYFDFLRNYIKQALEENCHLLVGEAAYLSTSQRNMERAGMRLAYTKAIWRKR
ncbi:hypothetical protein BN988_03373 [Oceanobacillus picturae]|uniref:Uncharacterized protein n=1 Tax=Oceanobacillus picturae TaxID=171693 RepID=W9AQA4_9BACI|nr:hypothetical protein BN988_03373 [Oceanobacillus picturae]